MPVGQLVDIICSDELNVRSEEQVFNAVMAWLKYNVADRRQHLSQVLQHVRLPLLSPKFLVGTVGSDLLVRSDEACRDLVDEAKNYLLLPQERPLMQGPRTRPRKPTRRGEVCKFSLVTENMDRASQRTLDKRLLNSLKTSIFRNHFIHRYYLLLVAGVREMQLLR